MPVTEVVLVNQAHTENRGLFFAPPSRVSDLLTTRPTVSTGGGCGGAGGRG